jgi:hypothetical protein
MLKQTAILFAAILILALAGPSCSVSNKIVEADPENYAVDGVLLETGFAINDDMEITTPGIIFKPNEQFYFYFNNDQPFEDKELVVQLIDTSNENILAESKNYEFYPEESTLTDMIWFGSPGRYKILINVDGELRAYQEVIIKE